MRGYGGVLSGRDFRNVWVGATVSAVGDGMTFLALTWLVLSGSDGTGRLGLLVVAYSAPVLIGGALVGPLLDRFDKRYVLAVDSAIRGAAVATVPVAALFGRPPFWLLVAVAAVYGLGKMVPLAGFPSALPDIVPEGGLDAANALESLSFGVAGVVGPILGAFLIGVVGASDVLAFDAGSFGVFAALALSVRRPLVPAGAGERAVTGDRPARVVSLARDRVLVVTTCAFMAFNVAEGMLFVTAPWLAKHRLSGGAGSLGLLLASLSAGEFVGAAVAGGRAPGNRLRAVGAAQLCGSVAFLAVLLEPGRFAVASGFFALGLFSAPMTVWAQSLRLQRVPPVLRGRAFAFLRTLMQATPPVGAACVTPLLGRGELAAAAWAMAAVAGLPSAAVFALSRGRRWGGSPGRVTCGASARGAGGSSRPDGG